MLIIIIYYDFTFLHYFQRAKEISCAHEEEEAVAMLMPYFSQRKRYARHARREAAQDMREKEPEKEALYHIIIVPCRHAFSAIISRFILRHIAIYSLLFSRQRC